MKAFIQEHGRAAPLEGRNIDTDQIVPARFLKVERSQGYGRILFHDLRFDAQGHEKSDFVLNQPAFRDARILVADENFGCGSSRESAVYALVDFGIRAVIAPSFGDIFHNNCLKNGIVPVKLDKPVVDALRQQLRAAAEPDVTVSLQYSQVIFPDGESHSFSVDPFWRECLLKGVDDLELTLSYGQTIEQFVQQYNAEYPWASQYRARTTHKVS